MMWLMRRWRVLSAREKRLVWEAIACLFWVRIVLLLFPLKIALRILKAGTRPHAVSPANSNAAEEIKLAVARAARHAPVKALCLQQAFAAFVMLRRHDLPATVHLGVRREDGGLTAHAWSASGNLPVTGTELASEFVPIAVFEA